MKHFVLKYFNSWNNFAVLKSSHYVWSSLSTRFIQDLGQQVNRDFVFIILRSNKMKKYLELGFLFLSYMIDVLLSKEI